MSEYYPIKYCEEVESEISYRIANGEKVYDVGDEPHVLAGDTFLCRDGDKVYIVVG